MPRLDTLVTWFKTPPPAAGEPLDPVYHLCVGSISSLFVLVPRAEAALDRDTWVVNLVMLFLAWVISTLILARSRETDSLSLVAKGVGLPNILFALGALTEFGG